MNGEVVNIKRILRCFELMSGLRINYHKSVTSGIGVQDAWLDEIAGRLNCKYQKLPFKYLGMPLGANPRRLKTWKPVVDRVKVKLASWKRRFLSIAGRLTLIKAVLSSLPVYYLSLFKIPKGVAKELDKIQAAFLWNGSVIELGRSLHDWEECFNRMLRDWEKEEVVHLVNNTPELRADKVDAF
ncbi:unnamed protein product [Camellia sinensis]